MKALLEKLAEQFDSDEEYRSAYAESFMNSYIAAQIKVLREQRELTQQALAEKVGTKQAGISRLENVNYNSWKVETLTKLAKAFDVRLKITFEEFGSLPADIDGFSREKLQRASFSEDPIFHPTDAVEGEEFGLCLNLVTLAKENAEREDDTSNPFSIGHKANILGENFYQCPWQNAGQESWYLKEPATPPSKKKGYDEALVGRAG
jgi:transcriptional regulator with XRE-family HTH domain